MPDMMTREDMDARADRQRIRKALERIPDALDVIASALREPESRTLHDDPDFKGLNNE